MSTLVQVKEEQTGDAYCVETDSESDEEIDADYLQPLGPKLGLLSKYPVGCKVLCNLRRLPVSSHLKAKIGSVQEVYIHFENGKRVYKVKTCALTEIIVYEEQLTYAINCPVTVSNADADGTRNGIVVYLERGRGSGGKQQVTYAVQFEEGDYITIESGVEAKRIKYKVPVCCVGGVKDPVTDEEEKDEEVRSQTSSTESSAQVDTKASIGSDSIPPSSSESSAHVVANDRRVSLKAKKEKPPTELQRKREHDFESSVNQRPNKAVKREEVKIEANNGRVEINNEKECVLTISSWWIRQWGRENRNRLFNHLIQTRAGIDKNSVSVRIFDVEDRPMMIRIRPRSNLNIEDTRQTVSVLEKSLVRFLADKKSEKRMLYELAATATGKICRDLFQKNEPSGTLLIKYDGVKKWLRLFDLPCCDRGNYHGFFLLQMKLKHAQGSDCKIEVFERSEKVPLASPYVSICGSKQNEVKSATAMVVETMRRHQRLCPCRPRW